MQTYKIELYRKRNGEASHYKGPSGQDVVYFSREAANEDWAKLESIFPDTIVLVVIEAKPEPTGYKLVLYLPEGAGKLRFRDGPLKGQSVVFPNPDEAAWIIADARAHGVSSKLVPTYKDQPNSQHLKELRHD